MKLPGGFLLCACAALCACAPQGQPHANLDLNLPSDVCYVHGQAQSISLPEQLGATTTELRLGYLNTAGALVWQRYRTGWLRISLTHTTFRARHAPVCGVP